MKSGKWGHPYSQRTPRQMTAIPNIRQARRRPSKKYCKQTVGPEGTRMMGSWPQGRMYTVRQRTFLCIPMQAL